MLASYSFTSESGSQTSTAGTSTTGVVVGPISRSAGITSATGTGSINATNWATAAQLDATKYYTFSLSPPSGCALSVTSLSIDVMSSGTGPTTAAVATSSDAFAQNAMVSTTAASMPSVSVTNAHGALELRVFGYGASATTGTMRLQNTLSVTGALH